MGRFGNAVKSIMGIPVSPEVAAVREQHSYDEGFNKGYDNIGDDNLSPPTSEKDSERWLQQLNDNPRLSGLNKIISDNGVTPFGIYIDSPEEGRIRVKDHPLELEIKKATVPMFFSLWTAYRYMTGTVFIAYDTKGGHPANFHVFTTTHLVKDGREGGSYTFQKGSKQVTYPSTRVIIDYDIDPNNPYEDGFGKAAAIMHEVEADSYILKYLTQFYVNSARPDAFIIPVARADQELPDQETLNRLATRLRDFHKGITNAHKMAILSFEAKVESIPTNHREMDLLETRRMYRDTSHQHFGIPPEIVGIVENSNKATVVAAEHIYAKQVRVPILVHFQDIINSKILPKFAHSEEMYFEFDDILPDDIELNVQLASQGLSAQSISVNEHRELMGLPRIKNEYGSMAVGTPYDPEAHGILEAVVGPDYKEISYKKYSTQAIATKAGTDAGATLIIRTEDKDEEV